MAEVKQHERNSIFPPELLVEIFSLVQGYDLLPILAKWGILFCTKFKTLSTVCVDTNMSRLGIVNLVSIVHFDESSNYLPTSSGALRECGTQTATQYSL